MMEIKIDKTTRMVNLAKTVIGNDAENLQETLVFKFTNDFVDGQARLEYMIDGTKYYIPLTKDCKSYTLPVKNVLTKEGKIQMQLVITEGINEEDIPVFKSNVFYLYCNQSINAVDEAPSSYELWIEQANAKLNLMDEALTKVDNVDIDVSKVGNTSTVEITNKNGTTKSVQITDGTDGKDGKDGVDGKDGIDGTDGISPTATISKSGNTATITITDKNGTTTATVSDGTNGTNGTNGRDGRDGYVQYTAGDNITIENNVISATGGSSTKVYNIDYNATNNEYVSYFTQWIDDLKKATPVVIIVKRDYSITTGEISWNNYSEGNGTLQLTTGFCWGAGTSSAYGVSYRNSGFMGRTATVTNDAVVSVAGWFANTDGSAITGASNLLGVNNTTAYSVTNDYNPAHKKYVDNSIASINNMMPKLFDLAGNTYQAGTPTPDAPQDIEVVTGDNEIVICGKNLFDNSIVQAESSATLEITATGFNITRTHTPNYGDEFIASYTIENLKPNTIYTFNLDVASENGFGSGSIYVYSDRLYGTALSKTNYVASNNNRKWNITTSSNGKIIIGFYGASSTQNKIFRFTNIQLEEGTTATTYVAPKASAYPINLGDIELCKIGTYQDKFKYEKGKWYLHKEIGKVVLDGSESWVSLSVLNTTDYYAYYMENSIFAKISDSVVGVLSNYFIGDTRANRTANKPNCWLNLTSCICLIFFV